MRKYLHICSMYALRMKGGWKCNTTSNIKVHMYMRILELLTSCHRRTRAGPSAGGRCYQQGPEIVVPSIPHRQHPLCGQLPGSRWGKAGNRPQPPAKETKKSRRKSTSSIKTRSRSVPLFPICKRRQSVNQQKIAWELQILQFVDGEGKKDACLVE